MNECSSCERALKFYNLKCPVCGFYNWRKPQIALSLALIFAFMGAGFFLLDNLALTEGEPMQPKTQQNESSSQGGSSARPNSDQFRYRKRIRGTSVGRPN